MQAHIQTIVVPLPLWETVAGMAVQIAVAAVIVWIVIRQIRRKPNKPNQAQDKNFFAGAGFTLPSFFSFSYPTPLCCISANLPIMTLTFRRQIA